jgi:quercetin dioxygenase-like cupin family protein
MSGVGSTEQRESAGGGLPAPERGTSAHATDPRVRWDVLRAPGPVEGVVAAIVHGAQLSAARYSLEAGVVVPEHAHENEEFGQVLSGSFELTYAGSTVLLGAGDGFLVPGGAPHAARAGDDGCELLECYAPPREVSA